MTTTGHFPSTGDDSRGTHTLTAPSLSLSVSHTHHLLACPVCPRNIASGWTEQKTPLPTVLLLLHDVTIVADLVGNTVPSGIPIGYVAWRDVFRCCVTVYCVIT
jgi:hypothetical protein